MVDVIAVGTAVSTKIGSLGRRMEEAMVAAIHACYEKGITDSESILKAKMEALERVQAEIAKEG
jgi:hypothetical protein